MPDEVKIEKGRVPDERPYRHLSLAFYAAIFYFMVGMNWILPGPMISFLDSVSPGHGREMTYNFLSTGAVIVTAALIVGLVIHLLAWTVERLLPGDGDPDQTEHGDPR